MLVRISILVGLVGMQWTGTAAAQQFTVLHYFNQFGAAAANYGETPDAGLSQDAAGNLYGTTFWGGHCENPLLGNNCAGTVFHLTRAGNGWRFNPIYLFQGGLGGGTPVSRVIPGPGGALYGTTPILATTDFGHPSSWGMVYKLSSPSDCDSGSCLWIEAALYRLPPPPNEDGYDPGEGDLAFDSEGDIYGTTEYGGSHCRLGSCGVVYELSQSGDGWTYRVLYRFTGGDDGFSPVSGIIFDQSGNLYGTAQGGAYGYGVVYQLTPTVSGYVETTLHSFNLVDGAFPVGGLVFDQSGNLYGTTGSGGRHLDGGTVFELTPSGSGWNFATIYNLSGQGGPVAALTIDSNGSLYDTTLGDGLYNYGNVFKLANVNGTWVYTDLHDFDFSDGEQPSGGVLIDPGGNLFGTASSGGIPPCYCGVVWEITP